MPECIEVKIISDQLKAELKGKTLLAYELSGLLKTNLTPLQLPEVIENVRCHGKRIIIELPTQSIIIALGMSGKFKDVKQKHTHVTFIFNYFTLYYNDVRRIGSSMQVVNKGDECNNLGPCLLGAALTAWISKKVFRRIFYKSGTRAIVDILMDQTILAGIGNYLRIDILYVAGIYPFRLGNSMTKKEIESIRIAAHEVVLLSYRMGGHTLLDYVDIHGDKGGYDPFIYGKKKDYNGFHVKYCHYGGRGIYYVKEVQI
jgi:formamidopyrimidine-DNA glycosylase